MKKLFALCLCLFLPISAFAERAWLSGSNDSRFFATSVNSYKLDDGSAPAIDQKLSNVYLELYPKFNLNFSDNLSIKNSWQFLVLKDATGNNRIFEDQGFVLEELYLNYANDQAEFFIGKFDPKFGYAWDMGHDAGIWGNDLAEQYKLNGKLGGGFIAKFALDDFGKHDLYMASFYDDTSSLNDALITRRDRTSSGLGDMSDTGSLSSYAINLHGNDFWFYPGFYYNLSYRNLRGTEQSIVNKEDGFSVGLGSDFNFLNDLKFTPYIEYANINGFNSFNNRFNLEFSDDDYLPGDTEYLNIYLPIAYHKWHFRYIVVQRKIDANEPAKETGTLTMSELSVSYEITKDFTVTIGRKNEDLGGAYDSSEGGLMLRYVNEF